MFSVSNWLIQKLILTSKHITALIPYCTSQYVPHDARIFSCETLIHFLRRCISHPVARLSNDWSHVVLENDYFLILRSIVFPRLSFTILRKEESLVRMKWSLYLSIVPMKYSIKETPTVYWFSIPTAGLYTMFIRNGNERHEIDLLSPTSLQKQNDWIRLLKTKQKMNFSRTV